jgi:hypothetical protein
MWGREGDRLCMRGGGGCGHDEARWPSMCNTGTCTAVELRGRGVAASHRLQSCKFKVHELMQDGVMMAYKVSAVALLDSWSGHIAAPPPHGIQPDGCRAAAASFRHTATGQVFAFVSLHLRPAADAAPFSSTRTEP